MLVCQAEAVPHSGALGISNQTHRSRTDPDATLAPKKGTPLQLKYKVHQTIDADSRVILDSEVTTGALRGTARSAGVSCWCIAGTRFECRYRKHNSTFGHPSDVFSNTNY